MSLPSVDRDKKTARFKAIMAAGAGAATVGLAVAAMPVVLVGAAAAGTGFLVFDWFRYRAKRGMRF